VSRPRNKALLAAIVISAALSVLAGCRAAVRTTPPTTPAPVYPPAPPPAAAAVKETTTLAHLGFTVQVGAFAVPENAQRLAESLSAAGLDAFYFPAEAGLYKVRFGNFASHDSAAREAERLKAQGTIDAYFIVGPADYAAARPGPPLLRAGDLRERLAATAESFIGVDYAWGGTSVESGFDCSGLVRAVYQLNGLAMPRLVGEQYAAGTPVEDGQPRKGDLVFFSASPGGARTHVGIYLGDGTFIHAPGSGKKVRRESLASAYYRAHYAGSRAYLK
jgi:gamma-D-glutamyl-L-lysine dipeptidyl-peptidase